MIKESLKKNLSSMQVLKTFKILLQGNYTMQELVAKLNENEPDAIFNNSVVSKYINTCRYCGIDIPKIHNKYFVANVPFGLDLSDEEVNLFQFLQENARIEMTGKSYKIFEELLQKINRFSNKKIARVEKEEYKWSYELFERAIAKKKKVKLMFKNRGELVCVPLKIADNNGKTFFHIFNKRERMIDISRLSGIEMTDESFIAGYSNNQSVVYKLKGGLAKRYSLRENESIVESSEVNGTITISNRGEDKEALFARLLRYDVSCEIVSPKVYREEFKALLEEALRNYGV